MLLDGKQRVPDDSREYHNTMPYRLLRRLQRLRPAPVGQGLVRREEALLLQDGKPGLPLRVAPAFRPPAFGTPTSARFECVRLRCRLP